ncbi:hypothetical protein Tco_1058169 [Tanacetum coccineum]|uniref:Uncharacterized protein n=1 Tax=Tanacetum coccineum TaxID=301880 RepID=A0ABQ5H9C1_9ASTR
MTSSSNGRGAAQTTLPWTTTEEITLCTAWCNAMDTTFKEHLEEEAKAEKKRAIYDKELEEFLKAEQAHDELLRMEFWVKSDSEYETY